jgi:hypothetical protein
MKYVATGHNFPGAGRFSPPLRGAPCFGHDNATQLYLVWGGGDASNVI